MMHSKLKQWQDAAAPKIVDIKKGSVSVSATKKSDPLSDANLQIEQLSEKVDKLITALQPVLTLPTSTPKSWASVVVCGKSDSKILTYGDLKAVNEAEINAKTVVIFGLK